MIETSTLRLPRIPRRRRFIRVAWFFVRLVSHIIFWDLLLGRSLLFRWYADSTRIKRYRRFSRRFRDLALDLGGVMIKLGQFASTRVDILPPAVVEDLIGLQDEVTPVPFAHIRATIERELRAPIERLFATFEAEPVAAASFGQVHAATLPSGQRVAIKVQRPQIEEYVQIDVAALRWVASWMQYYGPIRKRTNLVSLTDEFARITLRELEYLLEADHADRFRRNFAADPAVHVPVIHRDFSTNHVLTMEWVEGIKITDYAALDAARIDRLTLAEKLYLTYQQQCFTDGFFHADPHPGNLFVMPGEIQSNGMRSFVLTFLDFGMVDVVAPNVMEGLATAATGVVLRDAQRIIEGARQVGALLPSANEVQLRQALDVWFSYTYGRTIRELQQIDVEGFVGGISDVLYDLPFQLPQPLLFLGRAIGVVGGVAAGLAPDFDIFATTRPFAMRFIRDGGGKGGDIRERLATEGRELLTDLAQLPHQASQFYSRAARGDLVVRPEIPRLERNVRRVEKAIIRLTAGIAASALFLGGVLLQINGQPAGWTWWGAAGLLAWALWPRMGLNQ